MPSKRDTGKSSDYSPNEEADLAEAIVEQVDPEDYDDDDSGGGGSGPTGVTITGRIEWAGVEQRSNGGVRTTHLDGLDLGRVQQQAQRVRQAETRERSAPERKSFTAKTPQAQLKKLLSHRDGQTAMDQAGFNPSARTLRRWRSQGDSPRISRRYREQIDNAYREMKEAPRQAAQRSADAERHRLAQEFSAALENRYNAGVRIRDISQFRFDS